MTPAPIVQYTLDFHRTALGASQPSLVRAQPLSTATRGNWNMVRNMINMRRRPHYTITSCTTLRALVLGVCSPTCSAPGPPPPLSWPGWPPPPLLSQMKILPWVVKYEAGSGRPPYEYWDSPIPVAQLSERPMNVLVLEYMLIAAHKIYSSFHIGHFGLKRICKSWCFKHYLLTLARDGSADSAAGHAPGLGPGVPMVRSGEEVTMPRIGRGLASKAIISPPAYL